MNPETKINANTNSSPLPSLEENYNQPEPAFGFSPYAEQLNGRFAMIGFVGLLLLELFTQQDLFTWLGLR